MIQCLSSGFVFYKNWQWHGPTTHSPHGVGYLWLNRLFILAEASGPLWLLFSFDPLRINGFFKQLYGKFEKMWAMEKKWCQLMSVYEFPMDAYMHYTSSKHDFPPTGSDPEETSCGQTI
jgi:hypothetical protein